MFCFLILYFSDLKIITVSNGSFRKTTSLILSIISLSSIQSDSSILHLILFIHSLFKSQTTNITASSQITHYSISLFLSNTRLILTFLTITSLTFFHFFSKWAFHPLHFHHFFNQSMQVPVLVLSIFYSFYPSLSIDQNTKRESGRKVQIGNIQAAKVIQSSHFHLLIRL